MPVKIHVRSFVSSLKRTFPVRQHPSAVRPYPLDRADYLRHFKAVGGVASWYFPLAFIIFGWPFAAKKVVTETGFGL